MELLLVSVAGGALPSLPSGDDRLADGNFDDLVVIHRQDLDDVIATHPGQRVLGVAPPDTIRALVATATELEPDSLAVPEPGSLTCLRASRSGMVSLIYYNDCLHLSSHVPPAREEAVL